MVTTQRQVDIPASRARIGMHVVGLDRPWENVPLLFQSFVIDQPEQVEILRTHCQWITVERTAYTEQVAAEAAAHRKAIADGSGFEAERPLSEELPHAHRRYQEAQRYIDSLLLKAADGQSLPLKEARDIVRNCINSISSNPNAMFWLTRIRHRDAYTAEHCVRVGILAISFGRFVGLDENQLETVGLCGMLHDVGKMRIPPEVLNKPGALDADEWRLMQRHPEYGADLLGSDHELEPAVRDAALSHHERLDGKGYPSALTGPAISQLTRMVSIVDAYDAMTSDRAYREGIPTQEALKILYKNRGNQFDDQLVEAFIRLIGIYPPGSLVELHTGEVAVVLATNSRHKLRPLVEVVLDSDRHACLPRVLNLNHGPTDADGNTYSIRKALPDGVPGFSLAEHIRHQSDNGAGAGTPKPEPR
ncbi:HD-GYP domain-containing protein [Marinobacter zhanjiangensis]|uniref:Cyclic di-GMP phosphodiesterase n=1 Tax=Marinobacter zhanjiangensis TaxID=578215 RepID=A0ABQ3B2Z7_9GAMM|nr:HD-GYP domain-containing protein [Marinobacter zhanjiangensis]GGY75120.1 cyclic di-GMP phosphodiesterase [Marinobacter zhanjiangensis]